MEDKNEYESPNSEIDSDSDSCENSKSQKGEEIWPYL